jgi:transcriptional regulator with PAS, ATPase and Fis domain
MHQWNTIERMAHPEDLERLRLEINSAVEEHRPYKTMYRVNTPSGEQKWIWDQGVATYDADGIATHIEGILMDISAQKMRESYLRHENERLLGSLGGHYGLGPLVGKSTKMQRVFGLILKAARCASNVVIYGETGTGKDLAARTIHELSGRPGTYVPVNCGAIPAELLESEFFGCKRGAFSGADADRQGYLAAADKGTLFLDELGELDLRLQVKLLRVLETKQYTPVGGTRPRSSDFRLVAATNRDLTEMVKQGAMRPDFFYRVHVLAIHIPALREHLEDLPLLVKRFTDGRPDIAGRGAAVPPEVRAAMERYDWPGNVRELHNFLERCLAFGDVGFPSQWTARSLPASARLDLDAFNAMNLKETIERIEKSIIDKYLAQHQRKTRETARALGMNQRALQRKMRQYGL